MCPLRRRCPKSDLIRMTRRSCPQRRKLSLMPLFMYLTKSQGSLCLLHRLLTRTQYREAETDLPCDTYALMPPTREWLRILDRGTRGWRPHHQWDALSEVPVVTVLPVYGAESVKCMPVQSALIDASATCHRCVRVVWPQLNMGACLKYYRTCSKLTNRIFKVENREC